jgi:hypothetical protein
VRRRANDERDERRVNSDRVVGGERQEIKFSIVGIKLVASEICPAIETEKTRCVGAVDPFRRRNVGRNGVFPVLCVVFGKGNKCPASRTSEGAHDGCNVDSWERKLVKCTTAGKCE